MTGALTRATATASASHIIQWVYSNADPAHVEKLLLCNESRLAVIVASSCGDIRFCNDAVNALLGHDGSRTPAPPHPRLAKDGILYRVAAEALASQARSVLCHAQIRDGGDWLIVACSGTFDGVAAAFLIGGLLESRSASRGPGVTAARDSLEWLRGGGPLLGNPDVEIKGKC